VVADEYVRLHAREVVVGEPADHPDGTLLASEYATVAGHAVLRRRRWRVVARRRAIHWALATNMVRFDSDLMRIENFR